MPNNTAIKLTMRSVDALSTEGRDALFWDRDLPGFGIRVYRTGRKVYIVQARGPAGSKRAVIGRHGEIRADAARRQAIAMIDRIKQGRDPVAPAPVREPTVAELAARYMSGHVEVNCLPKTVETFGHIVQVYIVPELGHLRLSEVDRSHAAALHHKMRGTPGQANRTVAVLAKMFRLAEAWGMTGPRPNPCRSVRRYKEHRRERFLTPEEYRRLGRVLDAAQARKGVSAHAVAAIRLLLLTGCRKNEILTLRWDDIDRTAGELCLRDAKTGTRRVPLTPAVDWVLTGIPRIAGNPWVITGRNPGDRLKSLHTIWTQLRRQAGLEDVRIHDCRHSYASRALALGEGLPAIGRLLGHRKVMTTARYAHLVRDSEKAAAAKVKVSLPSTLVSSVMGTVKVASVVLASMVTVVGRSAPKSTPRVAVPAVTSTASTTGLLTAWLSVAVKVTVPAGWRGPRSASR